MRQDLSKAQKSSKIEIPLRGLTVSVCQNLKKDRHFHGDSLKFFKKEQKCLKAY